MFLSLPAQKALGRAHTLANCRNSLGSLAFRVFVSLISSLGSIEVNAELH